MRGSVHILVPKLIAKIGFEAIDKLARARNCQARGSSGEHSEVVDRIGAFLPSLTCSPWLGLSDPFQ